MNTEVDKNENPFAQPPPPAAKVDPRLGGGGTGATAPATTPAATPETSKEGKSERQLVEPKKKATKKKARKRKPRKAKPKVKYIEVGTPVSVGWIDSASHSPEWDEPAKEHKFATIESVGFVVLHNEDGITVAQSFTETFGKESCNSTSIPTGCITSINRL